MRKLASPQDVLTELVNIQAYCRTTTPSKVLVEAALTGLATQLSKNASEVTKKEWQEALKRDEAMLRGIQADIKRLEDGESVQNLTLEGAKKVERSLKQVIDNKKKMLSELP